MLLVKESSDVGGMEEVVVLEDYVTGCERGSLVKDELRFDSLSLGMTLLMKGWKCPPYC
jgi:hypothetical protein